MEENKHHKVLMTSYPLLIDYNGDYVADLFGSLNKSNANESRCIWKYSEDRTVKPKLICLESGKGPEEYAQLKFPHSNAFVDINNDGNADILVTTEDDFEVWINQGGKSTTQTDQNTNFVLEKRIPLPSNCTKNNTAKCTFGQLAFADFDLDGRLDMIFPACLDHESDDCDKLGSSVLYFSKVTDLLNADEKSIFKPTPIDLNFHHFNFKLDDPMYSALYPRIGDINLDGYPDLLIRVSSKNPLKIETHLLLNVDKNTLEIVEPPNSNMHRGFLLQKEIMPEHVGNIVMATFVDLYENGNEGKYIKYMHTCYKLPNMSWLFTLGSSLNHETNFSEILTTSPHKWPLYRLRFFICPFRKPLFSHGWLRGFRMTTYVLLAPQNISETL